MVTLLFSEPKGTFSVFILFFQTAQIPKVVNYATFQKWWKPTCYYQLQPAALTTFDKTTAFIKQKRPHHNQCTCRKDVIHEKVSICPYFSAEYVSCMYVTKKVLPWYRDGLN